MEVRAHIFYCGEEYECIRKVNVDASITIEVEPGPYWIDGPSIPITDSEAPFHDTNIKDMDITQNYALGKDHPEVQNTCKAPWFTPDHDELEVSQVKVKIETSECMSFIDIVTKKNGGNEILEKNHVPSNSFVENFWAWNISQKEEDTYQITVRGYANQTSQEPVKEESTSIALEWVEVSDLIEVFHIYDGDGYLYGGDRCPGHTWPSINRDKNCDGTPDRLYLNGSVDCSHYIYQGLRRLGRNGSNYNVLYRTSTSWKSWNRIEKFGWMEDISPDQVHYGDVILRKKTKTPASNCSHIGLFLRWADPGISFLMMDSNGRGGGCGEWEYKVSEDIYEVYRWATTVPGEGKPIFHQ